MKSPALTNRTILLLIVGMVILTGNANAAINNAGVLDNVLARYSAAAVGWSGTVTARASWLFWVLALISMVWTHGMLILKKADIGDFYGEFLRFTVFTGFFWWLLTNGPNMATGIMNSMRTIAGNATGLGPNLTPSSIVDIGFDICFKVIDQSSVWSPVDSAAGIIIGTIILIVFALIGVNMLLLLVSGWMLAYAGVFFLGFGGARWTSDMAISYYKTVLNIAAQLFTMVLLVGIGKTFVDQYYNNMSAGITLKELVVMLVVASVLLVLTNKVPSLIGQIALGGGAHALGNGYGAGTAMAAAATAAAAAGVAASAINAGASNIAGGMQAVMAAANKANENVSNGSDLVSRMMGGMADYQQGGGNSSGASNTTPLDSVMGGSAASCADFGSGLGLGDSTVKSNTTATDSVNGGNAESSSKVATLAKVAIDTAANLANGAGQVAKDKISTGANQTLGGQIATAIKGTSTGPSFGDNSLSGKPIETVDPAAEVAAFSNSGNSQSA